MLVVHGTKDDKLPIHHGRETNELLAELPVNLTYREYPMGHEITDESLQFILNWLEENLDGGLKRG